MLSSAGQTGGGSGWPASRNRCRRSLGVSLSACAMLSRTCAEGCTSRHCSSQTYQEVPILASCATSSRRNPGVRRRMPGGNPTSLGERRARRWRKKSARAWRLSFFCISTPPDPGNHHILYPLISRYGGGVVVEWGPLWSSVCSQIMVCFLLNLAMTDDHKGPH